jgi:hypothetical protein
MDDEAAQPARDALLENLYSALADPRLENLWAKRISRRVWMRTQPSAAALRRVGPCWTTIWMNTSAGWTRLWGRTGRLERFTGFPVLDSVWCQRKAKHGEKGERNTNDGRLGRKRVALFL